ncbi:uncharacterized protein N7482_006699 [Penicillium canariense]|uniref:Uncharacterized protein n=1 Tax=Penicillium canariense TaxID=189055 RepID=A0A9W9LJ73_9EURO|nr:uncharacterized protein N7482_006699 [Penicillium canariense]KAJ5159695.1 hypothetical protein N7482_006699 [Penicillium canariense]
MKTSTVLLAALAPAVLADPLPRAIHLAHNTDSLAHRSPAATIPNVNQLEQRAPIAELDAGIAILDTRSPRRISVPQVSSEGSLGQTPWIGMAIGLTCTALAAVMLG